MTTTYAYDGDDMSADGGTTTITGPHGNVTTQDYAYGVLWSTTTGAGTSGRPRGATNVTPPPSCPPRSSTPTATSPRRRSTRSGNPLIVTDPDGNESTTSYNSFNEPLILTDPVGIETEYTYDDHGNLTEKAVDGLDSTDTSTSYAVCESSCPSGFVTGDVESMTEPDGKTTSYTYDSDGDLTSSSITVGAAHRYHHLCLQHPGPVVLRRVTRTPTPPV